MKESVEFLIVLGLAGLLFLLRLDAQRFGVAEYDDSDRHGGWGGLLRRITWYGLGLGLVLLVYSLYPQPVTVLHLQMGADRQQALTFGLAAGVGGIVLAFLFAWFRYGGFRLPPPGAYPGALLNSLGTAVVDEAAFRGILLGLLLHQGMSVGLAIAIQALLYGLATRLWSRGRSKGMLFIDLVIAVVGGWLVVETGGIGAAIVAHAITRFSVFLATGHTDQARPVGWEPEDVAGRALPPRGWDRVGDGTSPQPWVAPPSGPPGFGPSYAGQPPFAPPGYGPGPGYPGPAPWAAPPPGMSNAPMGAAAGYADAAWGPPPGYLDPSSQPADGTGEAAGPWVADPEMGAWMPASAPPAEGWMPQAEGWTPQPNEGDGQAHG